MFEHLHFDVRVSSPPEEFERQAVFARRQGLFDLARLFDEIAIRKRAGFPVNPGQMPGIESETIKDVEAVCMLRAAAHYFDNY